MQCGSKVNLVQANISKVMNLDKKVQVWGCPPIDVGQNTMVRAGADMDFWAAPALFHFLIVYIAWSMTFPMASAASRFIR